MATVTERVERGAALLDEKMPGWHERIDLGTLELASPCQCIVGQLIDTGGGAYWASLDYLGVSIWDDSDYGLNATERDEWGALDLAWRELIQGRREGAA